MVSRRLRCARDRPISGEAGRLARTVWVRASDLGYAACSPRLGVSARLRVTKSENAPR